MDFMDLSKIICLRGSTNRLTAGQVSLLMRMTPVQLWSPVAEPMAIRL